MSYFSNFKLSDINNLLYGGGVRGALSMSIFWTIAWLIQSTVVNVLEHRNVFNGGEEAFLWVSGLATIALSVCGINNKIDRLKYAGLHVGSLMQIWIAVKLYTEGFTVFSFIPTASALWLFGAAMFFKETMNVETSIRVRKPE